MKILVIAPNLIAGGAERMMVILLQSLIKNGHDVTLFLMKAEGEFINEIPDKVKIVSANFEGRFRSNLIPVMKVLISESKNQDIVIGGLEGISNILALIISKIRRLPSIIWIHCITESRRSLKGLFIKLESCMLASLSSCIVFPSNAALKSFRSVAFCNKIDKLLVIYNAINTDNIERLSNVKLPLTVEIDSINYILGIGRLVPEKRFSLLIDSFVEMKKFGYEGKLLIIGDGPEKKRLESKVLENDLEDSAHIVGFTSNPYPIIKKADAIAVTSSRESFSLVVVEALYLGTPVMCSGTCAGPIEIIENGKFGVVEYCDNPQNIARAILSAIKTKKMFNNNEAEGNRRALDFDAHSFANEWIQCIWAAALSNKK
jgi:glycosyltransferase involved in cell wall biosynthesis